MTSEGFFVSVLGRRKKKCVVAEQNKPQPGVMQLVEKAATGSGVGPSEVKEVTALRGLWGIRTREREHQDDK